MLIIIIVVVVLVGGGAFFAGLQYQKSQTPSFTNRGGGDFRGQFGQENHESGQDDFRNRFSGRGGAVTGEIIAKDEESITVKDQDGGSKIVFISDTTTVRKTEEGTFDDLAEGTQVVIFGSENDNGSITAENIQLNPRFGDNHE